nr:MAG TPA: hypothetical protein [Caudoviricetes sp.]
MQINLYFCHRRDSLKSVALDCSSKDAAFRLSFFVG